MKEKNLEQVIEKKEENENAEKLENEEKTNEKVTVKKGKKRNIFLRVIGIVSEVIIWGLIVVLLFLLVFTTVSKKRDVLGYRIYVIMSGSMEPTINIGQAIITKEVDNVKVNDVIAFGKSDFITVHRIIDEKTEGGKKLYQTKGDNNNTIDNELVSKDIIKGRLVVVLPFVGEMILFLQNHMIILFIAIGILIMIIIVRRLIFNE